MKLAGSYKLRYDVTKQRAGPLTRKNAVNLPVEKLPFRVLSIDILIEGCGWVELVAQVRKKDLEMPKPAPADFGAEEPKNNSNPERLESLDLSDPEPAEKDWQKFPWPENKSPSVEPNWPIVDVFTPEGRFVASRRPMGAWLLNKPKAEHVPSRPRKSMRSIKKEQKKQRREGAGSTT
jgi:hypothetical protein